MTTTIENKTYNGWTNYETWNVKLWIDNDENEINYWNEEAEDCNRVALSLADRLKEYYDNNMHEIGVPELKGFYADLLNAALSEINWYEIAKSIIDDLESEGVK